MGVKDAWDKGFSGMDDGIDTSHSDLNYGAIYVWASGNGGENDDDCQADGYTISMYTIGIAAVSKSGTPTFYSEHCSAVMAAAYSGNNPDDPDIPPWRQAS
ncbi:hypothetical protein DPMN_150830 [Dreissena polymorpha]|uniref:Peptidase S8/S53 domain-containing protein n=1 Tax=Dreissena polymorpha TaxID=45954 RepID=A0A9D4J6D0_DREPO|nr:hypothetical protein DPMN_150830 [Dreissena polymorpha]